MHPYLATLLTFVILLVFLRLMVLVAKHGLIEANLIRKIIPMAAGLIYVVCWLLYPDGPIGPWLASLVPMSVTVVFVLIGMSIIKEDAAVDVMTRSGERREMFRGPLFFSIVFVAVTLIYWRDSLIGIPALMMLCSDRIAGLVGLRINSPKLPWSRGKSAAGSVSMFVGGWLLTMLAFAIYVWIGDFSGPLSRFVLPITWIALGATLVESLPLSDFDNLTVPLVCLLIGHLVF